MSWVSYEKLTRYHENLTSTFNSATSIPTGAVFPFAGDTAPSGYLLCSGQAVSRQTYSNLFAVIGTTYGTGNGSTTFNLPKPPENYLMKMVIKT